MRNFRRIVSGMIILIIFTICINELSCFLYYSASNNMVVTKKELKDAEGGIETLLIGNSLIHWGLDPFVIEEKLNTSCFNVGTSAQPITATYYVLKDQLSKNPVKRVFFGISIQSLMKEEDNTSVKVQASDIMSWSSKLEYMLHEALWNEYEQFLFYPTRIKNLFNFDAIKRNIQYKLSEDYKNHIPYKSTKYIYYGKGFESKEEIFDGNVDDKIWKYAKWNENNLSEKHLDYIKKMAQLCEEKNVEFNIIVFPHVSEYAEKQGDLKAMDVFVEEFCKELNIGLYNYNYTSYNGIYDILTRDYYQDQKHLNKQGASKIAEILSEDYLERNAS